MNKVILLIMLCNPYILFGQEVDSVATKMVDSLISLSREYAMKGDFDSAFILNKRVESYALSTVGELSAFYAKACFNNAGIYQMKDDIKEAFDWMEKSRFIRERAIGKNHTDYAESLVGLGYLNELYGDFDSAEIFFKEAIKIQEITLGKNNLNYAWTLDIFSDYLFKKGNFDESEFYVKIAIEIRERILGKRNRFYCYSSIRLANLYLEKVQFEKAESIFNEVKSIQEETIGKDDPDYAWTISCLASLYFDCGNYKKAEEYYLQCLKLKESKYGTNHSQYAYTLNDIAIFYQKLGNWNLAEKYFLETYKIKSVIFGEFSTEVGYALNNLGSLFLAQKNLAKSDSVLMISKSILEKKLGKDHPDFAMVLNNLGELYIELGKYEDAELFLNQAKIIYKNQYGENHPAYSDVLNNLGKISMNTSKFEEGDSLLLQAKKIREYSLGIGHPVYLESLNTLILNYYKFNKLEKIKNFILEIDTISNNEILTAISFLSENELQLYANHFSLEKNLIFSINENSNQYNSICFNSLLFKKGLLLNAISRIKNLVKSDPNLSETYNSLNYFQRKKGAEYSKKSPDFKNLNQIDEKINSIEKELIKKISLFDSYYKLTKWQEVAKNLKSDEAAIEFVDYNFVNPNPTDSIMYSALVLTPNSKEPSFIPLFEKKQLDSILQLPVESKIEFVNKIYSSKSLYDLIWKPLEKELTGIKTIYFSPSGLLHRINLGAIAIPSTSKNKISVGDKYQLVEMGSTRQIAIPTMIDQKPGNEATAILVGGLNYEIDTNSIALNKIDTTQDYLALSRGIGFANVDTTLVSGSWNYLKWTDVEVNSVESIMSDAKLKPKILNGSKGTEEAFKAIGVNSPSPRILHIASHGFFFPDPKTENKPGNSQIGNEPVFKMSDNPMIRSGLILSGGNYAWKNGKPYRSGMEDGILTAYEISQMNLQNTELVVLSACETGLGDIQGNEGVYGLQRAFKIAGAKYIIMSLWQVPDFQTQELMTTFYSFWLEDKMTIPEAFRAAQQKMKERFKDPYLWAGFVLIE